MRHYRYVKMLPLVISVPVLPVLSITIGASLIAWVIWPIFTFKLFYNRSSGFIVTPLSEDFIETNATSKTQPIDYSKASNWFPKYPAKVTAESIDTYSLSIPKLRINKATVTIGSNDLTKNLIHYGGTGYPGKLGNGVVFGHSVLPAFYDPNNYLTIFSLLPKLEEGDDIYINFDNVDYRYTVTNKRITDPADVTGLEQIYDGSYITLVTCVPPGTYLERLWVSAKLKPFGED